MLCAALVMVGARRAPALDARAPDAEIRRFAAANLPDGPYPGDFIDPAVRALLEEWSCAGGGTLPTTSSAPVAVLIEGARVRRATE